MLLGVKNRNLLHQLNFFSKIFIAYFFLFFLPSFLSFLFHFPPFSSLSFYCLLTFFSVIIPYFFPKTLTCFLVSTFPFFFPLSLLSSVPCCPRLRLVVAYLVFSVVLSCVSGKMTGWIRASSFQLLRLEVDLLPSASAQLLTRRSV